MSRVEDLPELVVWFACHPIEAARYCAELAVLMDAAVEAGLPAGAALLGVAVLVASDEVRLAYPARLDAATGRLDRAATEGYLVAIDLWVGPPLDGADIKPVRTARDMWGSEIGRAHLIKECVPR